MRLQQPAKNFTISLCMDGLRKDMDELVKRLRSSQRTPLPRAEKNRQHSSRKLPGDVPAALPSSPANDTDVHDLSSSREVFNIVTSQVDRNTNCFQFDFDLLRRHREDAADGIFMTAAEVRRSSLLKLDRPFYSILKSVELFGGGVYKWELCDETGIVVGSALVHEGAASIGDIVCLARSSLWKIDGNHLNIVDSNIVRVIRPR